MFKKILKWIDERIGISKTFLKPIPEYAFNITYWLGAIILINFIILGITGALLTFYYVPSIELVETEEGPKTAAYASTEFIYKKVPFGKTILTLHLYAAYGMIGAAFLHLVREFITGAYKKPRELMWIIGLLMGGVVLTYGFTGYLLPYTELSFYATNVGYNVARTTPFLGGLITYLLEGAGNQDIVQRFFVIHVFILPLVLLILLAIKMYMFEIHGAFDPKRDFRKTILKYYNWFPRGLYFIASIGLIYTGILVLLSSLFPWELGKEFRPEEPVKEVLPEWYFYWMFELVRIDYPASYIDFIKGIFGDVDVATITALVLIVIPIIYLFLVPFIDKSKEVHPSKRFIHIVIGSILFGEVILLSLLIWLVSIEMITFTQSVNFITVVTLVTILAIAIAGILYVFYKKKKWL